MAQQLADTNSVTMPHRKKNPSKTQQNPNVNVIGQSLFCKKATKGQLIHHDGLSLKFISISIFLLAGYLDFDMTHIE